MLGRGIVSFVWLVFSSNAAAQALKYNRAGIHSPTAGGLCPCSATKP